MWCSATPPHLAAPRVRRRLPGRWRIVACTAAIAGLVGLACALPAAAARQSFQQAPETYVCPAANGVIGVDCYLDAVEHLYTMCRQVKSIEIIEFGYPDAEVGVNGAKSESCADKHKASILKPFRAALKEASGSQAALDLLQALQTLWTQALDELKWRPPETDADYQARVALPYAHFRERALAVRDVVGALKARTDAKLPARHGAPPEMQRASAPAAATDVPTH